MIIFGCISVFLAAVIKGITAFGFNLIAVAVLIFFLSPKIIVPVVSFLSVLSSLYMLAGLWRYIQIKRILPLIIGMIAGVPFGVYGLVILRPEMLKVLIGTAITVFAVLFAAGFRKEIKKEVLASLLVGLISGILGGSTSLAGPPIVLFFINQDVDKFTIRANLTLYYVIQGILGLIGYSKGNLITDEVLKYSVIFLIPVILGIIAGMKLVHGVNEKLFRQITLLILIVSGLTSIYTGLKLIL